MAAGAAAGWVPETVTSSISDQVLASLDGDVLKPSTLPVERQRQLTSVFDRLVESDRHSYRLVFRDSPDLGANAIALPSGIIVVTDALVGLAHDEREVLGVLAHEAGHVQQRHGLRLLLQASTLTLVLGFAVGDFTSLVTLAPVVLLQAKYSRDFEREADAYAADVLRRHGIRPAVLADMLERIEAWELAGRPPLDGHQPDSNAPRRQGDGQALERVSSPVSGVLDYAAGHPATKERLEYLRRQ